jgi:uncharacterized protein with beta-barrel porin domain
MVEFMVPIRIISLVSIWLMPTLVLAVDYTVAAAPANTIALPNGATATITVGGPFALGNGDTLTVDNPLGAGLSLNTTDYHLGLAGNNTVTVESSLAANFAAAQTGFVFNPTGNGTCNIIINSGATITTKLGVNTTGSSLYNEASSEQKIVVKNSGTLNANVYANLVDSSSNIVAILGSAPPVVGGDLNDGTSVGNSYLYIGGIRENNVETLSATTFTYSNPNTLNQFYYTRVFAGSTFNLQAILPSSTTNIHNEWLIDSGATLNLQAATAAPPPTQKLTVTSFRNAGTVSIAAGANARTITTNNFFNTGLLQLIGLNSVVAGTGTTPSFNNTSVGTVLIGSAPTAAISGFTSLVNAGSITNDGTIANISVLQNNAGGLISFSNGSTFDTIATINNASDAVLNFDNSTSTNNAALNCNNHGTINLQAGNFGANTIINSGSIVLTGANLGGALSVVNLDNNAGAIISGTSGGISNITDFRNDGSVILSAITANITALTNNGLFSQTGANLTVTTFVETVNSDLRIYGASIVNLGGPVTLKGKLLLNSSAAFSSAITNSATGVIDVYTVGLMPVVINNGIFNIHAGAVYNAGATVFTNNKTLTISGATLTMTSIVNAAGASTTFSGSNTLTGNLTNSADVTLAGTFNHTGTYTGSASSKLIVNGITNYLGNNALTQNGIFQSTIVNDDLYGKLSVNQNISLAGCELVIDIDKTLLGSHDFIILNTGVATITSLPAEFVNINKFLYSLNVSVSSSNIKVAYERKTLNSLQLSDNSQKLAKMLEALFVSKKNLATNDFIASLLLSATSTDDVESAMQQLAPVNLAPLQNTAVQRNINTQLSERMLSQVIAYNSGEYVDGFSTWMRWLSNSSCQKTLGNIIGYKVSTRGFVTGMEASTINGSYVGLSLALTRSRANKLDYNFSSTTDAIQGTAYGQNYWTKQFFTNWLAGIVVNNVRQSKKITLENFSSTSLAKYNWQHFFIKTEAGYVLAVTEAYSFIPKLGAKATYLRGYAYTEYGGGLGVDLNVKLHPLYDLDVSLGMSFVADLLLFDKPLQATVTIGAEISVLNRPHVINATLVNSPSFENITPVPKVVGQAGFGIKYILDPQFETSFAYNVDYYRGFLGKTWQVQAKYIF